MKSEKEFNVQLQAIDNALEQIFTERHGDNLQLPKQIALIEMRRNIRKIEVFTKVLRSFSN